MLATSAIWVAVLLKVVPSLKPGHLYQHWRDHRITLAIATAWLLSGGVLVLGADAAAEAQNQLVGLFGLFVLAGVTATEAGLVIKQEPQ